MSGEEQQEEIKAWDYPYVEDELQEEKNKVTNAFNRGSTWKYEPPEQDVEVLPPTAEEIEAIRAAAHAEGFAIGKEEGQKTGYEEGFNEGKEQGMAQGIEEGKAEGFATGEEQLQQQLATWTALIESIQLPVKKVDAELEKELVLLSVSLAKSIIRSEVKTNNELIFQALSEGLKVLPIQEDRYQIHLHPADIELVNNHFTPEEIAKHHWDLIETPDLSQGGCEIVTKTNAVDVTVERRVKDVLDRFLLEQGLDQIPKSEE